MKNLFKKLTGVDKIEEELIRLRQEKETAEKLAAEKAAEAALLEQKIQAEKEEAAKKKSEKEIATERGEAWVNIEQVSLDPSNPGQGAFELDWNEFFVAKLVKAGYQGKNDEQIVDQWFQDVCRNVVLETYEQFEANNLNRVNKRDIGNGRIEVS